MYALYGFDSDVSGWVAFPATFRRTSAGKTTGDPQFVPLMGGGSLYVGPLRGLVKTPYTQTVSFRVIADSPSDLVAYIKSLNRACQSVGKLYRVAITGESSHVRAVFDTEEMETSHDTIFPYLGQWCADISLSFQVMDPLWKTRYHGRSFTEGDRFDSGYVENGVDTWTLDTATKTIAYSIGGERDVRDIDLIVTAGGNALNGITFWNRTNGTKLIYTGPVPTNKQVLFSCKRQAVEHLTPLNQTLAPGDTQVVCDTTMAVVGGSVSVLMKNGHVWSEEIKEIIAGAVVVKNDAGAPGVADLNVRVGFGAFYSNTGVKQVSWTQDQWLRLTPGVNDLQITRVDGGASATCRPLFWEVEA